MQQIRNQEMYQKLVQFVDKSEQRMLKTQGRAGEMVERGNVDEGLDMLSKNNQWSECL